MPGLLQKAYFPLAVSSAAKALPGRQYAQCTRERHPKMTLPGACLCCRISRYADLLARRAGFARRPDHGVRHHIRHALIQRRHDDILRRQLLLAYQRGKRKRGCHLHFLVDLPRAAGKRSFEYARERQHVVDLIRVVGTPGAHDCRPGGLGGLGHDLGRGICHREHNRPGVH